MLGSEMDDFKRSIDEALLQVNQLEQKVQEIEQFYSDSNKKSLHNSKTSSILRNKEKGRHISDVKKQQEDSMNREADASKRMQYLLGQFGVVLGEITKHKWAEDFMDPVDAEGLGLHDYHEVIKKPMDFNTIKKRLEAKNGCGYKHVREACADFRLVLKNAMKYNEEKHYVHVRAKMLLAKFEEKWLQILPKVIEEENRLEEEEAQVQLSIQLAQELVYAKKAKSTSDELLEMDMQLEELRAVVVQNCRKISTDEKRQLSTALTRLSPDDLFKALEIVAEGNPSFQATAEEVDLDIDALSETTLWRLKFFVKGVLQAQAMPSATAGGNNTTTNNDNRNNNKPKRGHQSEPNLKTARKRSKKDNVQMLSK